MTELEIPTCVSLESWAAFVEVRRRKGTRAPLTDYAAKLVAAKLLDADRHGYDAQYMLDQAIEHGWTSVYVRPDTPKVSRAAEQTRAALDAARLTPEQRARSDEARRRVMAAVRVA